MTLGTKIKEYRTKLGLTQKDLAEKLHVTYQAVSRWENGDVEPSVDTIMEMTKIFNCSADELFGIEKDPAPAPEPEVKIVEKVIVQEARPVLAVCEECNKPLFDKADVHRGEKVTGYGRTRTVQKFVLCTECDKKRVQNEALQRARAKKEEIEHQKTKRKRSFVWPSVIAAVLIAVGIYGFVTGRTYVGIGGVAIGVLSFPFVACLFLDNTFMPDMWLEVASWGFVKMPGVIFGFSLGGFIVGIAIKIFLWLVGFAIAIAAFLLATALGLLLGVFVYPVALKRSFDATKEGVEAKIA